MKNKQTKRGTLDPSSPLVKEYLELKRTINDPIPGYKQARVLTYLAACLLTVLYITVFYIRSVTTNVNYLELPVVLILIITITTLTGVQLNKAEFNKQIALELRLSDLEKHLGVKK